MRNLGGNFFEKCDAQYCQNLTYHCFLTALTGHINGIQTPQQKNTNMVQLKFLGACFKEILYWKSGTKLFRIHFAKVLLSFQLGLKESQNLWLAILTCWGLFAQKVHLDIIKNSSYIHQKLNIKNRLTFLTLDSGSGYTFFHEKNPLPHLTLRPCHLHRNGPWHLRGQSCCPGSFSFRRQPKWQLGSCRKGRNCFKRGNGKPCVVEIPPFCPFSQVS